MKLNAEQAQAVYTVHPSLGIEAGAGTGKTRTIIGRLVHLVHDAKVPPWQIVCFTFTRKAAGEMKERAIEVLKDSVLVGKMFIGTIHSWCLTRLRQWPKIAGRKPGFATWTEADVYDVVRLICLERRWKVPVLYRMYEAMDANEDLRQAVEQAAFTANALRYDDLITATVEGLGNPLLRFTREARQAAQYILVDEMQDTSDDQVEIIRRLRPKFLFAVGDRRQSIYEWRNARPENVVNLCDEMVSLRNNYRSASVIVEAGNALAARMFDQAPADQVPVNAEGGVVEKTDDVRKAVHLALANAKPGDVMMLGRTWAQLERAVATCQKEELPVDLSTARYSLLADPHVRGILRLMQLHDNPHDEWAVRMVNDWPDPPLSHGAQMLEARQSAIADGVPLLYKTPVAKWVRKLQFLKTPSDILRNVVAVVAPFMDIRDAAEALVYKEQEWNMETPPDQRTVRGFLDWLLLQGEADNHVEQKGIICAQTVHTAKGLEADCVIIIDALERCFPSQQDVKVEARLQEARRLFYVAVTRARKHVVLVVPKRRFLYVAKQTGKVITTEAVPSRFIEEMGL